MGISLNEQIKATLERKGTLGPEDLNNMGAETAAKPNTRSDDEDTKIKVGSEALDAVTASGNKDTADKIIGNNLEAAQVPEDPFAVADDELETVVITAADKKRFQDCFVDGTRFTRGFSVLGGRVKGVFRCRKTAESRAIMTELTRLAIANGYSASDYAAANRKALLHCQLAELSGVVKPEFQAPLRAVEKINIETKTKEIVPPAWVLEMDIAFDNVGDAVEDILYKELKTFEKVYWTMVRNAGDQNFWDPEDSTIG